MKPVEALKQKIPKIKPERPHNQTQANRSHRRIAPDPKPIAFRHDYG